MPEFATPESIDVNIELRAGRVTITATDRTDTAVEVRPSNERDASDVEAASQVRVDYANGTLRITAPRSRSHDFSRQSRSVDVSVALPSGSRVTAETHAGDVRATGRLGQCRLRTSAGNISVERTGPLHVRTSAGHVTADEVAGDAVIHTGSGKVRLGDVTGTAAIESSNGETTIDAVTGDTRVRAANGDVRIERAGGSVDAKTSNGAIRLGRVAQGTVTLATAMGDLEIGIADGTAAWLEVNTSFGQVRNQLENAARPEGSDRTVEVHGRTSYGDITIHRAN